MAGFLDKVLGNSSNSNNQNDQNDQNNQNSQNNQNNNQTNNQNNNQTDNLDSQRSIWENNQNQNTNQNQNQNQNVNTNQNQNQNINQSPAEAFQQHIDSLNLTAGIDLSSLEDSSSENYSENLQNAFKTVSANTYKAAMTQMNQIIDSKLNSVKEDATKQATASINADMAINQMNSELKFTSDPDISPVAKAVLKQFINNGKSVSDSILAVKSFFESTAKKVNPEGLSPDNSFNNSNFNNSTNNNNHQNGQSTHDEWLDILAQ